MTRKQREAIFDSSFLEDLRFWIEVDRKIAKRVMGLVEAVLRDPFTGLGKPEPIRRLNDTWSRRINDEHRLVYRVQDDRIYFLQARFHYQP